jgi:hypothetical protein
VTVATGISGHVIKHYCDCFVPVPLAYSCTSNCFVLSTLLTCRETLCSKENKMVDTIQQEPIVLEMVNVSFVLSLVIQPNSH